MAKEGFRKQLEKMLQNLLLSQYPTIDVSEIRLKCYGSLNNGFGLANCDMDLLLALPREIDFINKEMIAAESIPVAPGEGSVHEPAPSTPVEDERKFEVALLVEGALLDWGIGARLLTKTRVPILKVCETPSLSLLDSLRAYRREEEAAATSRSRAEPNVMHTPPEMNMSEITSALSELSTEIVAAQFSLPVSPPRSKPQALEFTGDCGIQCDVNFTNFVAIHNTILLRTYCEYDARVGELGTFVKYWAKQRDINTPYLGTLSSYGYTLLVLHYLMNVVNPPVIPNLQQLAYSGDSWSTQDLPKFEGKYDVRFWQDPTQLREYKATQPRNRESTGHLLRGFFWYYSAYQGFNFKNDMVSIRTRGGTLRKVDKGWTEAKWSDKSKNVRQRYLLAIEDPFETDHNVARVVGHNGIVAIRDEFRRAWSMISSIGGSNHPQPMADLLEPAQARGDLLRKDQDHHREKVKKMKQEAEAKQQQDLQEALSSSKATGTLEEASAESWEPTVKTWEEPQPPVTSSREPEADNWGASQPAKGEREKQNPLEANGMFNQQASQPEDPPPTKSSRRRRPQASKKTQLTEDDGAVQDNFRPSDSGRMRKVKADSDDEDEGAEEVQVEQKSNLDLEQADCGPGQASNWADNPEEEPFCMPSDICESQGYDMDGNPVAWDMHTQDGRWLRWRDRKVEEGKWRGAKSKTLDEFDRHYPYDSRRPVTEDDGEHCLAYDLMFVRRAPFPLNKESKVTSTQTAMDAAIIKPSHSAKKTNIRRSGVRRLLANRVVLATAADEDSSSGEANDSGHRIAELDTRRRQSSGCVEDFNRNSWSSPAMHIPVVGSWDVDNKITDVSLSNQWQTSPLNEGDAMTSFEE